MQSEPDRVTKEALDALAGATTLLEILTLQALAGKMTFAEAQQIVINHAHYRRQAIANQATPAKLREIELEAIREALDRNHWHRSNTARELGISRKRLYDAIEELEEKPCRAFSASA